MGLSSQGIAVLESGIKELGIDAPHNAVEKLCQYLNLIESWNEKINLTRIVGDEAATLHFLDALSLVKAIDPSERTFENVVDVGTGLGVPGIVLKIVFPNMKLTLVDSLKKRVLVLEDMISHLGLIDTRAIHARAEDLGKDPEYREKFSLVTARAVSDLRILSELCLPLARVGGFFAAYKGDIAPQELLGAHPIIKALGGSGDVRSKRITVPHLDAERTIILVDKISKTPPTYPRPYRVIEKG